jgi:hypothetical protein
VQASYYQEFLGRELEKDMGFRHGADCLPSGNPFGYTKAVSLISVAKGGVFAKAGFRAGDVLPEESLSGLFKRLHRCRGRITELNSRRRRGRSAIRRTAQAGNPVCRAAMGLPFVTLL